MEPDADVRAPGAAVTVVLCGHWDHEPPCPLAPLIATRRCRPPCAAGGPDGPHVGVRLRAGRPLVQHLRVSEGRKLGFSAAEMRRRRAAFGRELDRGGMPYALVYGANRSGSAVSWLTGWPVTREALLVVAPDEDDDVLLVSFFNHVPQARRVSVTRVEWTGERAVATALDLIAARGRLPSRIGLAGALPFGQYRLLAGQVPDVVDLNAAYTAHGGLHHIHYLGITAMDEPDLAVPAQWPTGRVIRPRDIVTCEISAAAAPDRTRLHRGSRDDHSRAA